MNMTLNISLVAALSVLVAACAITADPVSSLRGSNAASVDQAPIEQAYAGKKPGGQQNLIARTFKGQPPLIPHSIDGYEDITATENACLDCHISDQFRGKKMPAVGPSHLLKPTSSNAEPVLDMQHWQCNSCHVPQIDAKPLVENTFRSNLTR